MHKTLASDNFSGSVLENQTAKTLASRADPDFAPPIV
jgi:hypothetical protein